MGNRMGRALRRGTALGLVLAAAWGVSLTADLRGVNSRLAALGEEPALAAALMEAQLGAPAAAQLPAAGGGGGAGAGSPGRTGGDGASGAPR